jgi:hypothetical protein
MRCQVVETLYTLIGAAVEGKGRDAAQVLGALAGKIATFEVITKDPRLADLKSDVGGRITKALSTKERFNRWGRHYLRALTRAHQIQQCTNFMDPGLQKYGGMLFHIQREMGGTIFVSLPPPTPTMHRVDVPAYSSFSAPASAPVQRPPSPVQMDAYYGGGGGGCLGGSSLVTVVNGEGVELDEPKAVSELRAGDKVRVSDGGAAKVRCLIRLQRDPSRLMRAFPNSSLTITPGHPILYKKQWILPRSLPSSEAQWVKCVDGFVYSVVLDRSHVLRVGHQQGEHSISCITWGHGMKESPLSHPFFGSQRVIEALEQQPGWKDGYISNLQFVRRGGEVVGFV